MLKSSASPARAPATLPPQPFFVLGPQRVRLARERYFDQGQRPTGLVAEPVIQSWARCLGAHQSPQDAVAFDPVSRSRVHAALARNRHLLLAAGDELLRLEAAVGGTGCRVLLTDNEGVVVHATAGHGRPRELLPIVSRVGVNLAEAAVGTNAPAVVLKTGQACTVSGAEHFYDSVQRLHCAASPIRDAAGQVAGVLDLTVEARPFGFDASALVAVVATTIENRLLQQGAQQQLVLQFQMAPGLLGSPLEALVGVSGTGHVVWANGTAQQLLGLGPHAPSHPAAEALFGCSLDTLLALSHGDAACPRRLPNGLTVWMRAQGPDRCVRTAPRPSPGADQVRSTDGPAVSAVAAAPLGPAPGVGSDPVAVDDSGKTAAASTAEKVPAGEPEAANTADLPEVGPPLAPQAAPDAPTLVDHQRELIDRVLAECQGNISRAARRLGVSRGLLYRRRRDGLAGAAAGAACSGDAD